MSEGERARILAHGLFWNLLSQLVRTGVSIAAMLVLVRIIPPVEYGRVSAVVGILTLLGAFGCGQFMSQALQLPDGEEPDWTAHFRAGFFVQLALSLIGHAVAGVCWFLPQYRPIAALLHVGAAGMLVDWPGAMQQVRLRRAFDFRRLNLVILACSLANVAVSVGLGRAGLGAYAIVLGGNVATNLPAAVDLLLVQRWRPRRGWLAEPPFAGYRPALRFGVQQALSALMFAARGFVAAAALPATLGFQAMGLINRAQGLYTSTIGRGVSVLVDTVYPVLPRYAADPARYSSAATAFTQSVLWLMAPLYLFLGLHGVDFSRILYGQKWIAADPLLWPAAVNMLASLATQIAILVVLAQNHLRLCLMLEIAGTAITVPTVAVTWWRADSTTYLWVLAGAQTAVALVSLAAASRSFVRGWALRVLLPLAVAATLASAAALGVHRTAWPPWLRLTIGGTLYLIVYLSGLRLLFAGSLGQLLDEIPGGARLRSWARL